MAQLLVVSLNSAMSRLVNYRKRRFTLPHGCENLVDIWKPSIRRMKARTKGGNAEVDPDQVQSGGLTQLEHYLSILLGSRSEVFTLTLSCRNEPFALVLYRSQIRLAIVLLAKDAEQERAIRAFFDQHRLQPLQECSLPDVGEQGSAQGMLFCLPFDPEQATRLTTDLLRTVYGFSDTTRLDFRL